MTNDISGLSKPTAAARLVLSPGDPDYVPADLRKLVERLTDFGLLGTRWKGHRFLVGKRFMQEIVFVGCSPFLRVDPRDDLDFCHIEIPEPTVEPLFYRGPQCGGPRCPECRTPLGEALPDGFHCDVCNKSFSAHACLWRPGRTVHARFLISIWNIHKGDARPTEGLLQMLETFSGMPWKIGFL